jgi:hypothetical protein
MLIGSYLTPPPESNVGRYRYLDGCSGYANCTVHPRRRRLLGQADALNYLDVPLALKCDES